MYVTSPSHYTLVRCVRGVVSDIYIYTQSKSLIHDTLFSLVGVSQPGWLSTLGLGWLSTLGLGWYREKMCGFLIIFLKSVLELVPKDEVDIASNSELDAVRLT